MNAGKRFEADWRESIAKAENVWYYRFRDSPATYYGGAQEGIRFAADNIRVQKELEDKIGELTKSQDANTKKLHEMEETQKRESRNRLRDILLERYRYYTDPLRNPGQSWTTLEAEAFWELFGDYERAGGDGYMHSVVQPAMNRLRIDDKGVNLP